MSKLIIMTFIFNSFLIYFPMTNRNKNTERRHTRRKGDTITEFTQDRKELVNLKLTERNVMHIRVNDLQELAECFAFGDELGRGNFARVIAVTDKCSANNQDWALKIIPKPSTQEKMKYLQHEINILKLVDHPHIIHLDKIYESTKDIFLLLEKCLTTLHAEFKQRKVFPESLTRKIIWEIASAISYLHKYDIVHRDLKLENVLVSINPKDPEDRLYVKLSDFGLSAIKSGVGIYSMLHDFCGTLHYMSPEMLSKPNYSHQCDVWSLGIIMYMLLSGHHPFDTTNEEVLVKQITTMEPKYTDLKISPVALTLLKRMLTKDPAQRITAAETMTSEWFSGISYGSGTGNVLDMMREWHSDLKVPGGNESDWVLKRPNDSSRQAVDLSIQNITFDRSAKKNTPRKTTTTESKSKTKKAQPAGSSTSLTGSKAVTRKSMVHDENRNNQQPLQRNMNKQ